jgi:hypothetical protein
MAKTLMCRFGRHKWELTGPDAQHLVLRCSACSKIKALKQGYRSPWGGDSGLGGAGW